uniref:Uncharacterized protein n=1 Tax=Panagrellus redivivus TaxID=6233 RepID=A0A7E4VML5_PANRE
MHFSVRTLLVFSILAFHYEVHAATIDETIFTNAINSAGFNDAIFYGVTDNCIFFITHTVKGLHEVFSEYIDRGCTKTNSRVLLRQQNSEHYMVLITAMDGHGEIINNIKLPLKNRDKPMIVKLRYKDVAEEYKFIENFFDEKNDRIIMLLDDKTNMENEYQVDMFQFEGGSTEGEHLSNQKFALTNFYQIWKLFGDTLAGGYVYAHGQSLLPSPVFAIDYGYDSEAKPIEIPWTAQSEFDHVQNFGAYGALWVVVSVEKLETLRVSLANGESFDDLGVALECTECEFNGFIGVRGAVDWSKLPPSKQLTLRYIETKEEEESKASQNVISTILTFITIVVIRQY